MNAKKPLTPTTIQKGSSVNGIEKIIRPGASVPKCQPIASQAQQTTTQKKDGGKK
jgi:hypothetical protein